MWRSRLRKVPQMVQPQDALPGRNVALDPGELHTVFKEPLKQYDESQSERVVRLVLGMGCFWGAERIFWRHPGVVSTAVGYAGGYTPHPTYQEVCSGLTGHTEVVQVYFDSQQTSLSSLLKLFWENHDPTQGMRQGNDVGTQYRSALYWTQPEYEDLFRESAAVYQNLLSLEDTHEASGDQITTDLSLAPMFYYAEEYHQQYLHKNPDGYCGLRGTGIVCPL